MMMGIHGMKMYGFITNYINKKGEQAPLFSYQITLIIDYAVNASADIEGIANNVSAVASPAYQAKLAVTLLLLPPKSIALPPKVADTLNVVAPALTT